MQYYQWDNKPTIFELSNILREKLVYLTDIEEQILGTINDEDPVYSHVWHRYWNEFDTQSRLAFIKNELEYFIHNSESLFDNIQKKRLDKLQKSIFSLSHPYFTDDPEGKDILGSLFGLTDFISFIKSFEERTIEPWVSEPLLELPKLILPSEVPIKELISRLGQDPRSWTAVGSRKFEEILAEIWAGLGWETILTPPKNDGGFDIRAIKNAEGVMLCYLIEAKAYDPSNPVGIETVRRLYGVVERERASHGILATTSYFTKGALSESRALQYKLSLADFNQILKWVNQYSKINSRYR